MTINGLQPGDILVTRTPGAWPAAMIRLGSAQVVPLHGELAAGRVALVSPEDFGLVMQYRWHVYEGKRDGRVRSGPYARSHPHQGPWIWMHTLITGWPETDHRDHDGLNNQRFNLRPVTHAQNSANRLKQHAPASSRYKGVTWHAQRAHWRANIRVNGKLRHLGSFTSEEDAARAYDIAALTAWGEHACLNFPVQEEGSPA